MPEQSLSNTHFLHKAHRSFLVLGNTGQHFSTMFGGDFKQQNHQQKAQKCKTNKQTKKPMALNRPQKGHLFTVPRAETRKQCHLVLTSAGNTCVERLKFFAAPFASMNDHEKRCGY